MIYVRPTTLGHCATCPGPGTVIQGLRGALGVLSSVDQPSAAFIDDGANVELGPSGATTQIPNGATLVPVAPAPAQTGSQAVSRAWGTYGWIGLGVMALGASLAGYHGYRRSGGKLGSTLGWAFLGGLVPIVTVPVALAQGFGKHR